MDKIEESLTRIVSNIIPGREKLENTLRSGKKLNVYYGIDPTFTRIHLGNAVPLRELQMFVELGHNVTFLIGDFTALIGDTSDKNSERPVLTYEQIKANFQSYKKQASKIIDFSKTKVRYNHEWLSKLNFEEVVKLTRHFTLNDFISRELIKRRLSSAGSVSLPEILYPVMQGYDSYFLDTDIQIGGTDQIFNMQAGRTLQKDLRAKESFIIETLFPLEGTDGRKMSKSWGNAIWLDDSPNEIFGKVMSLKDDLIFQYFRSATNLPLDQLDKIKKSFDSGENPMKLKKELAKQIVSELQGKTSADKAQIEFEKVFQKREIPSKLLTVHIPFKSLPTIDLLTRPELISSKSAAKRLISGGAIEINSKIIQNHKEIVTIPNQGIILKIGKRQIVRVVSAKEEKQNENKKIV